MTKLSASHICFNDLPKILCQSREWHRIQQQRHPMHPVIQAAYLYEDPASYGQLMLEWPYVSDTDASRLAYTQDDRAAEADRQTLTTVGKYLKRHFPKILDHTIRDLVAKYATVSAYSISAELVDIVTAVQDGPSSCMQMDEDTVDEIGHHPYEAYKPAFGWAMAVRKDGHKINGRALVMQRKEGEHDIKYFVRTYRRSTDECSRYSGPDEELSQWLQAQGYAHRTGWRNEKLGYIEHNGRHEEFVAPYIDGNAQSVTIGSNSCDGMASGKYLAIGNGGDWECTNTDGTATESSRCTCDDCGDRIDEDQSHSIGYHGETAVGSCCIDNYIHVHGRRGNEYYVAEDEAVECDGEWYDRDYLGEHDIVQLNDGEYTSSDNAVYVESEGDYYRNDDEDIVEDHNNDWQLRDNCVELENGDWALEDDAWCCESSGDYYLTDDVDPVRISGLDFHPDTTAEDIAEAVNASERLRAVALQCQAERVARQEAAMAPVVVAPVVEPVAELAEGMARVQSHATMAVSTHTIASAEELVEAGGYTRVDDSTEPRFLMRGQSGVTHLVRESRVQYFKDIQWTLVEVKLLMINPNSSTLVNVRQASLSMGVLAGWTQVTEDHYVKSVRMSAENGGIVEVAPDQVTGYEADGWAILEPVPPVLTREGYNGWLWADRMSITSPKGSLHWVTPFVANIYAGKFGFAINVHIHATEPVTI